MKLLKTAVLSAVLLLALGLVPYIGNEAQASCSGSWDVWGLSGVKSSYQPGETINGSMNYKLNNPSDCPSCIQQIVVGLVDQYGEKVSVGPCIYNGIPKVCEEWTSGSGNFSLTAPSAPGTYRLIAVNDYQYRCSDAQAKFPAQERKKELAAIVVGEVSSLKRKELQPGTILAWGQNNDGQINAPAGDDFVAISGGSYHSLALRADGSLVAWGYNYYGQLNVPAGNDFVTIAAGTYHNLALKGDGSIVAWGCNDHGQTDVPPGNDFVAIAAGAEYSLALKANGSLVAWGCNAHGELDVPLGNDFVAISGGVRHCLALRRDGSLVVWGSRDYDQWNVPPGNDFVAIAAGHYHCLALKADGSLVAWGENAYGQSTVPTGNDFVAIAAGREHSLAIRANGSLVAWGDNGYGQLNVPPGNNFVAVAAGAYHSLAIAAEGETSFPGRQDRVTHTGNTIDFGDVLVGETKTVTYTFKILETSATSATVMITRPNAPFGSDAPIGSFVLAPGQSISFNVTFTPTSIGSYTGSFTITVEGGSPPQARTTTITVIGRGVPSPFWPPVPPRKPQAVLEIPPEVVQLVAGNTEFAFDLYQAIRGMEGNLLYSPYSVSLALAMTYAGARDTTEGQMAQVLHFTLPQEDFHPALQTLSLAVASRSADPKVQLIIANSLWVQTGYSFLPAFLDLLTENYDAAPRHVDFFGAPGEACDAVNEWVSRATEGKIKNLLTPAAIKPLTQLILANAIYFKADWLHQFPKAATRDGPFYLLDGSEVIVSMMGQEEDFRYTSGEGYQAIELPYSGERLSMVILIPKEAAERSDSWLPGPPTSQSTGPIDPVHFEDFERSLNVERFASIVADLRSTTVQLIMPKFTYESSFNLKDTLVDMGMPDAFTGYVADFSGMDGTRLLYISDVVHKAFVAVDEEGTEAAAVTAVHMATGVPPEPVQLTIDCPFIFVIRDVETGAILFVGRVLDPRAR